MGYRHCITQIPLYWHFQLVQQLVQITVSVLKCCLYICSASLDKIMRLHSECIFLKKKSDLFVAFLTAEIWSLASRSNHFFLLVQWIFGLENMFGQWFFKISHCFHYAWYSIWKMILKSEGSKQKLSLPVWGCSLSCRIAWRQWLQCREPIHSHREEMLIQVIFQQFPLLCCASIFVLCFCSQCSFSVLVFHWNKPPKAIQ